MLGVGGASAQRRDLGDTDTERKREREQERDQPFCDYDFICPWLVGCLCPDALSGLPERARASSLSPSLTSS